MALAAHEDADDPPMTFRLDFRILRPDSADTTLHTLVRQDDANDPAWLAAVADPGSIDGQLVIVHEDMDHSGSYEEPMVRLCELWLRKLPWIISGDTETVALRNTEQCFAFVPAGESVELSFFAGTEAEIEDYVLEPVTVRRDAFVAEVLRLGEALWLLCQRAQAAGGAAASDDTLSDVGTSLRDAKAAWHDLQIHQRR